MTAALHNPPIGAVQAAEDSHLGFELARYRLAEGDRVLVGRRVGADAIVVDLPAGEDGRVYLVERNVQTDGYAALRALVDDYVATAVALGRVPMARTTADTTGERAS